MTEPAANPKIVRKLVVIFDICSSTAILEDLIRTENHTAWQQVLGNLKRFCWGQEVTKSQMYKFLGDGWIFVFDDNEISGERLIRLLTDLSIEYRRLFYKFVDRVLANAPPHVGMTFGVDEGSLVELTMNGKREYVGRAMNVAARLQSATKTLDGPTAGTMLMSSNAFERLNLTVPNRLVECSLANVAGGHRYRARRMQIPDEVVSKTSS